MTAEYTGEQADQRFYGSGGNMVGEYGIWGTLNGGHTPHNKAAWQPFWWHQEDTQWQQRHGERSSEKWKVPAIHLVDFSQGARATGNHLIRKYVYAAWYVPRTTCLPFLSCHDSTESLSTNSSIFPIFFRFYLFFIIFTNSVLMISATPTLGLKSNSLFLTLSSVSSLCARCIIKISCTVLESN